MAFMEFRGVYIYICRKGQTDRQILQRLDDYHRIITHERVRQAQKYDEYSVFLHYLYGITHRLPFVQVIICLEPYPFSMFHLPSSFYSTYLLSTKTLSYP